MGHRHSPEEKAVERAEFAVLTADLLRLLRAKLRETSLPMAGATRYDLRSSG